MATLVRQPHQAWAEYHPQQEEENRKEEVHDPWVKFPLKYQNAMWEFQRENPRWTKELSQMPLPDVQNSAER
ncbi:hypothetical protein ASY01nite_04040 [Acetobacter syzygii]|nr:hypothetical protein Absy_027_070 [Acetobacter syzygii]GBR64055.1 hypothetical protein AA0483_1180 [Acetobacter syzygii NRIC 0483]GEL55338.1 hypothetical protein ASY01nite_04040 [Acetobacter syzygii]